MGAKDQQRRRRPSLLFPSNTHDPLDWHISQGESINFFEDLNLTSLNRYSAYREAQCRINIDQYFRKTKGNDDRGGSFSSCLNFTAEEIIRTVPVARRALLEMPAVNLLDFPDDILIYLLSFLSVPGILCIRRVRYLFRCCSNSLLQTCSRPAGSSTKSQTCR